VCVCVVQAVAGVTAQYDESSIRQSDTERSCICYAAVERSVAGRTTHQCLPTQHGTVRPCKCLSGHVSYSIEPSLHLSLLVQDWVPNDL